MNVRHMSAKTSKQNVLYSTNGTAMRHVYLSQCSRASFFRWFLHSFPRAKII